MRYPVFLYLCLIFSSPFLNEALGQSGTSKLWGQAGELWEKNGNGEKDRLPDFSYAGYHYGEVPLPHRPIVTNVKNFGAKGNGTADDTQAFQNAINATSNGAIWVPPGTYKLSNVLRFKKNNVVLRGAGPGQTVLHFTKNLTDIFGYNQDFPNGKYALIQVGTQYGDGNDSGVGSKITNVTADAPRLATSLKVGNTNGIQVGDRVLLSMYDDASNTLGWKLNNDISAPGSCVWQPFDLYIPLEVQAVAGGYIFFKRPLPINVDSSAWSPEIRRFNIQAEEVGIEDLTIDFPNRAPAYAGHHNSLGQNGINFRNVKNCWARNVHTKRTDVGFKIDEGSTNVTVKDCKTKGANQKGPQGYYAHYGFSSGRNASLNLFVDCETLDKSWHPMSFGIQPNGSVYSRIKNFNGKFDMHRGNIFENLFTEIDLGKGSQVWGNHGAFCAGDFSAARNTFHNCRLNGGGLPKAAPVSKWAENQNTFINASQGAKETANREWIEQFSNSAVPNLHESQRLRRLGVKPQASSLEENFAGGALGWVSSGGVWNAGAGDFVGDDSGGSHAYATVQGFAGERYTVQAKVGFLSTPGGNHAAGLFLRDPGFSGDARNQGGLLSFQSDGLLSLSLPDGSTVSKQTGVHSGGGDVTLALQVLEKNGNSMLVALVNGKRELSLMDAGGSLPKRGDGGLYVFNCAASFDDVEINQAPEVNILPHPADIQVGNVSSSDTFRIKVRDLSANGNAEVSGSDVLVFAKLANVSGLVFMNPFLTWQTDSDGLLTGTSVAAFSYLGASAYPLEIMVVALDGHQGKAEIHSQTYPVGP